MTVRYVNGALDCALWQPPQRTIRREEKGVEVERIERRPTIRSEYWVNPQGHCVWLPLHNGGGQPPPADPYESQIKAAKSRPQQWQRIQVKPWVRVGACPKAHGHADQVPAQLREKPLCTVAADGHPIGVDHPCACVVAIIAERQGRQAVEMTVIEERHQRAEARDRAAQERQLAAQQQTTEKLVEVLDRLSEKTARK